MAKHKTVKCPECGRGVKHHRLDGHIASVHPRPPVSAETRETRPERDAVLERETRRMERETERNTRKSQEDVTRKRRSALKPILVIAIIAIPLVILFSFGPALDLGIPGVGGGAKNTATHQHPHLEIIIRGQKQTIPVNIGIDSGLWKNHDLDAYGGMHGQMSALHTHGTDGVIHMEMKSYHDCTLGNFFDVWGQPFDDGTVMSYSGNVKVTVDGKEQGSYEHRGLVLQDGQQIVVTGG